jgi:hypothetical protein
MDKHTKKQETKETNTQKNPRFRNNRISDLVVLVLLLQHPVLVLVFKQKLCLSLTRWLPVFSCLSVAATWSVLPSVRFDFSSGSGDQLCGPPALLLCSWVFSVLVYWGLVSLPHAPSLGQGQSSAISSLLSACYGGLLVVFQFCNII